MDKFILLLILYFASANIPNYLKITRNNTLNFQLDNPNSTFYAYLPYEEDYEINDISNINNHFLRLDKKIGFKHRIIENKEDFPDESKFNKNSKGIDSDNNYEYQSLETFENIKLKEYYKLKKDTDKTKKSIFVFYLEDEYKDSFDSNENYTIFRVQNNIYDNNKIIDDKLENDNIKLYIFESNHQKSNNSVIFINHSISTIYEYDSPNYKNMHSNINLFQFNNEENIKVFLLFVYNPNDEIKNISIEYKIKNEIEFYRSLDMKVLDNYRNYTIHGGYRNLFYISIEPGLYKILDLAKGNKYMYLFKDDINEIKNLTDLINITHYKYTREGNFSISNNYFMIMISSNEFIEFDVEKIEIKENIEDINMDNFEYFKITEGNTINFPLTREMENFIFKLVSNNSGTLNINSINYTFNQTNYLRKINIQDNNLIIKALDNNFTFAIKLEIHKDDYSEVTINQPKYLGKGKFKFLIYDIRNINFECLHIYMNRYTLAFSYEFNEKKELSEMTKGAVLYADAKYLDLQLYPGKSLYLFIYAKNYGYDSAYLDIEYIPQTEKTKNNWNTVVNSFSFFRENEKISLLFIMHYSVAFNYRFSPKINSDSINGIFKLSLRAGLGDYLYINEKYDYIHGYYIYYHLDDDEEDYSYISGSDSELYLVELLNETHMRFYINETFSNAPQIDYKLVFYEPHSWSADSEYEFFKKYYLNEYSGKVFEIYNFTKIDLKKNSNNKKYIYYTDLPFPKKFDFNKKNQKIEYRLMGITGPKYNYVKIYDYNYLIICYETCSTCSGIGNNYDHNCKSCIEGKVYYEYREDIGYYIYNCIDKCPKSTYEKNKICQSCYGNCETCSGEGSYSDNKCLSCNISSDYKYLINVPGQAKNCVAECPDGTILKKYECIKDGFTRSNIMITVGVVGGFILIVIDIIIINHLIKSYDNDYSPMNIVNPNSPSDFIKETEMMENKINSDLDRKVLDNTPKDFKETPETPGYY